MKKGEIVKLLQHRRHDLVNDVQVMHGYASMEMFDKVEEKLNEFLISTEHERKLHMLQAPSFILWVETFCMKHQNFNLTYEIHDDVNLKKHDEWITNTCEKLIQVVKDYSDAEELYELYLKVYKNTLMQPFVQVVVDRVNNDVCERVYEAFDKMDDSVCKLSYKENKLTCEFQIDACIEG